MEQKKSGLLTGSLWRSILAFALPIAATSILQQLFNSTDTAVVGRFAGSEALAAVGSTAPVVNLCITIFMGLSVGANVKIAQAVGAGSKKGIRELTDTSMLIALLTGLAMTVLGELTAPLLLQAMGTPDNILDAAVLYMRIYYIGMPFLMIYNFEAAILRGAGDTKRPLECLLLAGVLNLLLNLLFVAGFHMGVAGVALGTLIADAVDAGLLLHFLLKGSNGVKLDLGEIRFAGSAARSIFAIGIPAAIQGMMFDIANMIIQTGFNSLGSVVVAGSTIGLNAEIFVYYLETGFAQAAVTFNGQNLGAGNVKRCRQATRTAMILGTVFTMGLSGLFILFSGQFAGLFTVDAAVKDTAMLRMHQVLGFEFFNMTIEILSGAIRGLGYSAFPAALAAVFICGTRLVWMGFVFPQLRSFSGLLWVYPVSWMLTAAAMALAYRYVTHRVSERMGSLENS